VAPEEVRTVHLAALLHDIGHYPFSHALEEAGLPSHERLAAERLAHPDLQTLLEQTGIADLASRLHELIAGTSRNPLQGLISGSMDLDKIEYLRRDAQMCGVPYGTVDVDRLVDSLALVERPGRRATVGVHERGISALESLLFAKYQMYRNVYWHHAVRSATAMFKRAVRSAISRMQISAEWISQTTDEVLIERLRALPDVPVADRLLRRRLYKRALDLRAADVPADSGEWIARDPDSAEQMEDRLAVDLSLEPGEVLIDFPAKPAMLDVDLPVVLRDGETGRPQLELMNIAEALHASARRFRVFVAEARSVEVRKVLKLVEQTAAEVAD
jgi:HD superfamily phosphohydrolase